MTKFRFIILAVILFLFSACSVQFNRSNSNNTPLKNENVSAAKAEPTKEVSANANSENQNSQKDPTADNSSCYKLKRDDLILDKKQTFVVDFKPFEKSCFVTFHDPEFDNPALGSQFYIYKNGKEVFNFPEQFGGANTSCWVDGVAFEDLNNDRLTDIIVVGKCGAKMGEYNENMVYLNNGKGFVTNVNSNAETMDFSKTSQIKEFVTKNPELFSK